MSDIQKVQVFLSYARKDVAVVNELYENLKSIGFSPWQDHRDLLPGQQWKDSIIKAIRESTFFLACLSNNSVDKRGMIHRELNEALDIWKDRFNDDIFLIPVKLEDCTVPEELMEFHWVNLYEKDGFSKLAKSLRAGLDKLAIIAHLELRSQKRSQLSEEDLIKMLRNKNFYEYRKNWSGKGIFHAYELKKIGEDQIVIDYTTELSWQQSDSGKTTYEQAIKYVNNLNIKAFANKHDRRLPTAEEAMSLMQRDQSEPKGLFMSSIFYYQQERLWTIDLLNNNEAWEIDFTGGWCGTSDKTLDDRYVRAVRSGTY
jgi:hypothetical protein